MIPIILIVVWFASLAAFALRIAIVRRERTGSPSGPEPWDRSPRLLDASRDCSTRSLDEVIEATLVVSSSESAAAEHVRDGAQEDLYVGP